jgi:FAD/FMN-containing dehydrogenase
VHASADENPDLFWGVRGGGGNFGVVTCFQFGLHPTQRQVVAGDLVFPLDRAQELLGFYAEYSASVPREMYIDAIMSAPPGGKPGAFVLSCCWSGDAAQAETVLAPVRKLGKPIVDTIQARDYEAVQRLHDRADPRNEGQYLKSGFIRGFNPALVEAIVTGFRGDPQRSTALFFQHGGGAVGDVAADATAFPHRYASHNMLTAVTWPLEIDRTPHVDYLKKLWGTLEPHARGYYMNEVADEGQAVVDENYQGNIARMRAVKKRYDPINLFRLNANVQPA